jgi:hypothetical protein
MLSKEPRQCDSPESTLQARSEIWNEFIPAPAWTAAVL